jgi:hypothetical protein
MTPNLFVCCPKLVCELFWTFWPHRSLVFSRCFSHKYHRATWEVSRSIDRLSPFSSLLPPCTASVLTIRPVEFNTSGDCVCSNHAKIGRPSSGSLVSTVGWTNRRSISSCFNIVSNFTFHVHFYSLFEIRFTVIGSDIGRSSSEGGRNVVFGVFCFSRRLLFFCSTKYR